MEVDTELGIADLMKPNLGIVDGIKILGWAAFILLLAGFFSSLQSGNVDDASVLLGLAAVVGARATCEVIHRRYLAYRGLLRRVPLSWIGSSAEVGIYATSLERPSIDIVLYLTLFALGFVAAVLWPFSPFFLAQLYLITLAVNSRLVHKSPPFPPLSGGESRLLLMPLQPLSYLLLVPGVWLPSGSSLREPAALLFWPLQLVLFVGLLLIQRQAPKRERISEPA